MPTCPTCLFRVVDQRDPPTSTRKGREPRLICLLRELLQRADAWCEVSSLGSTTTLSTGWRKVRHGRWRPGRAVDGPPVAELLDGYREGFVFFSPPPQRTTNTTTAHGRGRPVAPSPPGSRTCDLEQRPVEEEGMWRDTEPPDLRAAVERGQPLDPGTKLLAAPESTGSWEEGNGEQSRHVSRQAALERGLGSAVARQCVGKLAGGRSGRWMWGSSVVVG